LELQPCLTYAALTLWNFNLSSSHHDLTDPNHLSILSSFTGTVDEQWFSAISVSIEACGAKAIPLVLQAFEAVSQDDEERLIQLLGDISKCVKEVTGILGRMYDNCRPTVFYHQIRPMLAGSKNMAVAGLPDGVFYDQGAGKGEWCQYSGGSNAQSSLIQLFDLALGVEHPATGEDTLTSGNAQPMAESVFIRVYISFPPPWTEKRGKINVE
jgi:indoleamine 2,3-dioxygenase